jgi:hypothetical protein
MGWTLMNCMQCTFGGTVKVEITYLNEVVCRNIDNQDSILDLSELAPGIFAFPFTPRLGSPPIDAWLSWVAG